MKIVNYMYMAPKSRTWPMAPKSRTRPILLGVDLGDRREGHANV